MAKVVVILIRVLFAIAIGLLGLFALGNVVTALAYEKFVLFGWPGAMMVCAFVIGVSAMYASWRLFRTTLTIPN